MAFCFICKQIRLARVSRIANFTKKKAHQECENNWQLFLTISIHCLNVDSTFFVVLLVFVGCCFVFIGLSTPIFISSFTSRARFSKKMRKNKPFLTWQPSKRINFSEHRISITDNTYCYQMPNQSINAFYTLSLALSGEKVKKKVRERACWFLLKSTPNLTSINFK